MGGDTQVNAKADGSSFTVSVVVSAPVQYQDDPTESGELSSFN